MQDGGEVVAPAHMRDFVRENRFDLSQATVIDRLDGHTSVGVTMPNTPGSSELSELAMAIGA
jgi:hypothetical protein